MSFWSECDRRVPELQEKWGKDGTYEGALTPADLEFYLDFARNQQIPVVLEVDFDIAKIGDNKFIEADDFLQHVFQKR
jgi:hypothetical protein